MINTLHRSIWLLLVAWLSIAVAKKEPEVSETKFESQPVNLFYFDDSNVAIVQDLLPHTAYRSTDGGANWKKISEIEGTRSLRIVPHPTNNKVAVAVSMSTKHWITRDQGETWHKFELDKPSMTTLQPIVFHASDADKLIFLTVACKDLFGEDCVGTAYYSTDGGKSWDTLRNNVINCAWAKGTARFTTGDEKDDEKTTLCIAEGKYSHYVKDNRLLVSNDYFKTESEPPLEQGRNVQGHVSIAAVKGYIAAAAKVPGSVELALYVTDDTRTWHRAVFDGHTLEEDGYTLLESTNYSIQVDVVANNKMSAMGTLFTSNSNGTYFTQSLAHTNRDSMLGFVDFEKIQNIQGLVLANTVDNWKEVDSSSKFVSKKVVTSMSFDDGRTWQPLKVGDDRLHLHSVTEQRNVGRIFSSPAPGIVMGVGSLGKELKSWDESDTFVSDDAGVTWKRALRKPHLYEFGDQGAIIVAIEDGRTNKISYSINHGKDWEHHELKDEIKPVTLQTGTDSTTLKFVLTATKGSGSKTEHFTIFLDFAGLHERDCKDSDFEEWPARVDDKGKPTCIMGHKQFFTRRKANAECFVEYHFKDPEPRFESCTCTDEDYECDFNFVKDEEGKKCVPAGAIVAPKGACKNEGDTYKGSSGYRLIPGNVCEKKGGVSKDEPVERPCKDTKKPPAAGKVTKEITTFEKETNVNEYYYLERNSDGKGDSIIMQTANRNIYITHDHGKVWAKLLPDEEIIAIYPHQYLSERFYLLTTSKKVYYSHDRGNRINSFEAPEAANHEKVQVLSFHPKNHDWLIWTGGKDCSGSSANCHTIAHSSTNGGNDWKTLLAYVKKCQYVSEEQRKGSDKLIYCEQHENEDPSAPLNLVASDDYFEHKTTHFTNIVSFATMSEYIVVAMRDKEKEHSLRVQTSVDGSQFAYAEFPHNFQVGIQEGYTVLDSSTHSIFLHVTVNSKEDQEQGAIIKSNSNGTSYVLSASHVNRNRKGFVDFEKMQGLEGVALINIVSNIDENEKGGKKKLRTLITHNDGGLWAPLNPPEKDSEGKMYECKDSSLENCGLHLHGYTERKDPRNTYSSPSAVGLMMGVGNVGPFLGAYKQGDTFITRDGGITWHEVFKGTYTWEYGDQGSIIVIVKQDAPVKSVFYTRDEGSTWTEYQFSDKSMIVDDISTVPGDNSRNFLLWAHDGDSLVTVNLDFTGLTDRLCKIDEKNPEGEDLDYYLWRPKHPLSDGDCLFGHVAEYHRKKVDADCYNGPLIQRLHNISETCECTRQDFECDYNYQRQHDGSCALVEGLEAPDHEAICKAKPDTIEWYDPTGYRRIPLTTCQGGKELEYSAKKHPCPGKEEEFYEKNGIGALGLFFAIVIPIAAAAVAGYWVWINWDGKFGRIRLGDGMGGGGGSGLLSGALDSDSPLVKIPVLLISGVVAVAAALPMLLGSLWRAATSRFGGGSSYGYSRPYTSRNSFQRTRGDYAAVDEDEGELLGEDSEDEAV